MGTPTNRTPVRVARGSTTALNTGLSDIQEGEIVWDTTLNKLQVKEGSALEDHTVAADAGKQDADADLTALSSCQTGAAAALALLTSTEVEVLDGATVTTAELNILDGVTSTAAELNILDGVTSTAAELNILDGVTSTATELNLLDGKTAVGDAVLANDQNWTGAQRGAVTALTDASTIAVDFNSSNNYSVTLAGNRTLGQPTNQVVGQSGSIFVTQDGTGSRTLAYHADWKWAGGTAPTLTTTAAAVDRIDYIVAAANKIHAVATLAVA